MPRIDDVAASYVAWSGDRLAAEVGLGLLRSGVADASHWRGGGGDPVEFIRLAIRSFVERHGGPSVRETFRLHTVLAGGLNDYSPREREVTAAELYLIVEPSEAGYIALGPTMNVLEHEHPRLPVTFFRLLFGALNRWARVYDYTDARDHVEMLRDWYSGDPDCANAELPDVEASIPQCMRERPFRPSELRRMLPALSVQTRDWLQRAADVDRLSRRRARPRFSEQIEADLSDCNPPLPSLLVVFTPGDNVEACFDAEAQSMMEVEPEPNLIIPFDATDVRAIRQAFGVLATMCETLAAVAELIRLLPSSGEK